ncbi:Protein of unknown function [Mucilaginibacter pineti]|uniref:DUF2750 domain-containing protein n=1 Tax=Mucilaginibacter pineti TaxID=1391627 RepID=A0A1G7J7K7_9SPHI|nr:DUF2750 domain-containing protein [Mucilaginibacter pineti]SDF20868.1 Protein of unknown function [Mucilaginibacter pineti]
MKGIENIINMNPEDRYLYFIRKITDFEEVWGLYNEGWATATNEENQQIVLFWPEKQFAVLCAENILSSYEAKAINLTQFMETWLPGMIKDNAFPGIFYIPNGKGIVLEPEQVLIDINQELKQY